jgi:hypothetical protein
MAKTIPADEKVFMVSKTTNTTYSGSAALKAMNEWYTMDDVTNTVRPYKVYTALLTQSGGSVESSIYEGTPLTIGVTYLISDNADGGIFTNVGSPNNNVGTYFVATGTTPTSWNGAELTYNTGAPVATVLENTIGNVWFTYNDVGNYFCYSYGLFTINKSINTLTQTSNISSPSDTPYYAYCTPQNANELEIIILDSTLTGSNDLLYNKLIEIRVYS